MEFSFEAVTRMTLSYEPGAVTSQHVATDFFLELSDNLDRDKYLDEDDLPTKEGSKVLTNTLIQGLVGNVHLAHQRGWFDSAEHLRFIIAELEKGFAAVADVQKSKY